MGEIEVRDNPLGIKAYAIGTPSIDAMTEEQYDLFVSSLELRMSEYLEKSKEVK